MVKVHALALLALTALAEAATILQSVGSVTGKPYTLNTLAVLVSPAVLGESNAARFANILNTSTVTVFAPTDAAFTALQQTISIDAVRGIAGDVLSYHVSPTIVDAAYLANLTEAYIPTSLSNSSLTSLDPQVVLIANSNSTVTLVFGFGQNARVIDTIVADNGVIHVIDNVLVPPSNATTTLTAVTNQNVAGIAFGSLAGALTKYNLSGPVDTVSPITVFAPLDSAFTKLAPTIAGLNDSVLDSAYPSILTYHVIAGAAAYKPTTGNYTTLNNESLAIVNNGTLITVNGIPVVATVLLKNGVAHVLGDVLVPASISSAIASIKNTTSSAVGNATATVSSLAGAATSVAGGAVASVASAAGAATSTVAAAGAAATTAAARSSASSTGSNAFGLLAIVGAGLALLA